MRSDNWNRVQLCVWESYKPESIKSLLDLLVSGVQSTPLVDLMARFLSSWTPGKYTPNVYLCNIGFILL